MKPGFRFPHLRPRFALLWSAVWLGTGAGLFAQALTPEQLEKILQELKAIETEVEGSRLSSRTSAVAAFQKGAASDKAALELYLACYKEVHFDRQDARGSDFRDWREKNEERVKDAANVAALRLQLQYLVLTLKAAEKVSLKTLVPEVESFAAYLVANAGMLRGDAGAAGSGNRGGGRGQAGRGGHGGTAAAGGGDEALKRLREPVNNTVFAEAYGLDKTLKVSDWSMNPGNVSSLYEKTVLPYFRASEAAGLAAAWDRRIKLETDLLALTSGDNPAALETFRNETLPQLNFDKSSDVFRHVSQQQGALAILGILKTYPAHPRAGDWLQAFRGLLEAAANPAGATTAAGPGAAPAAQ